MIIVKEAFQQIFESIKLHEKETGNLALKEAAIRLSKFKKKDIYKQILRCNKNLDVIKNKIKE